jgi:Flp pilus assembly pilin Flp
MLRILACAEELRLRIKEQLETGQGLAEYALILAFTGVIAITALTGVGTAIVAKLGQVSNAL